MDTEMEIIQEETVDIQQYIKLADGTEIDIEPAASLGNMTHIAENEADALVVIEALTRTNIKHIEFWQRSVVEGQDDEKIGEYDDLIFASQPTRQAEVDEMGDPTGRVIITISLREQTDIEKRLSLTEEDVTNIEVALADVYEMIV